MGCGASAKPADTKAADAKSTKDLPKEKPKPAEVRISDEIGKHQTDLKVVAKLRKEHSISDDYDIDANMVCGTGFAGPVLLCTSKTTQKVCAVKSYNKKAKTPRQFEMLKNEVEVYLTLDHPHIARLHNVYETSEDVHLVMEYCCGGELYHRLVKVGGYSEQKAAETTYQMLTAVNYLHNSAKVVHRDLKLENWLYATRDENAPLKLIDFGFSKNWEAEKSANMQQACGSLPYAAPDLLMRSYTNKCDMWSLGVIVFMMLSGEPPFYSSQGDDAVKNKILNGQYNMRPEKWNKISWNAVHLVASLLTVDPNQRLGAKEALDHPFIKERMQLSDVKNIDMDVVNGLRDFMSQSHLKRAVMCMMAYSLSSQQIEEFEDMFKKLDVNHTGMIKLKDFMEVMKENLIMSNDEITRMFEVMDSGDSGELSYTQFVAALMQTRVQMHGDMLREVFERFDTKKTGFITAADLKKALGEEGYEGVKAEDLMAGVGCTTGKLDLDQFIAMMTGSNENQKGNMVKQTLKVVDRRLSKQWNKGGGDAAQRARMGSACRMSKDVKAFGTEAQSAPQTPEMLEFEAKLRKNGIDVSAFGKGEAKSVGDLFWEVQKSECVMGMHKGKFKRMLDVLRVELWAETELGERVLMEGDQELQDGRTRTRSKPMSKKMSVGENWEDALRRAFGAELGLQMDWQMKHLEFKKLEDTTNERDSKGYPGIKTVYKFHNVHVRVTDPKSPACADIGLPGGDDFETTELSIVGTDRKHFWKWEKQLVYDEQVKEVKNVSRTMSIMSRAGVGGRSSR